MGFNPPPQRIHLHITTRGKLGGGKCHDVVNIEKGCAGAKRRRSGGLGGGVKALFFPHAKLWGGVGGGRSGQLASEAVTKLPGWGGEKGVEDYVPPPHSYSPPMIASKNAV